MSRLAITTCLLAGFLAITSPLQALGPDTAALKQTREKGIAYLKSSQADDGTWSSPRATGVTALVVYGLLTAGVPADDPTVAKTLAMLEGLSQADGSLTAADSRIPAYETAISLMALQAAGEQERYKDEVDKAVKYLRGAQIGANGDVDQDDLTYGGVGYSPKGGRPDLSNTAFLLDALQSAGVAGDDPAVKRAMVFISRCQNLESEFNNAPGAGEVDDGGFYYTIASGGQSPAGANPEGGLRSYGSMTYAGFKSMLYAGLDKDDPRVKAAINWIRQNFTVTENPGMGSNGLFYYYYLSARALRASGLDYIEDEKGVKHDWRKELAEQLIKAQQPNGSWVNSKSDRWFEGDPSLVTAYVLVALQACEPPAPKE